MTGHVVLDASAILSFLLGEAGAEAAAQRLEGAIMSTVNTSEALAKLVERGMSTAHAEALLANMPLTHRPFTLSQAQRAAWLRPGTRAQGLSLGDRACLALALEMDALVVTADRAWADLDLGVEIELIR